MWQSSIVWRQWELIWWAGPQSGPFSVSSTFLLGKWTFESQKEFEWVEVASFRSVSRPVTAELPSLLAPERSKPSLPTTLATAAIFLAMKPPHCLPADPSLVKNRHFGKLVRRRIVLALWTPAVDTGSPPAPSTGCRRHQTIAESKSTVGLPSTWAV